MAPQKKVSPLAQSVLKVPCSKVCFGRDIQQMTDDAQQASTMLNYSTANKRIDVRPKVPYVLSLTDQKLQGLQLQLPQKEVT